MRVIWHTIPTPDGPFGLLADETGAVLASGWTDRLPALQARVRGGAALDAVIGTVPVADDAVRAYYDGELAAIDSVTVNQSGTAFQHRGWQSLREIEPGAPLSYAAFAAQLDAPRAVRAAASICARNAVALFVPCHRVLRGDGSVGGFAWGAEVKRSLLAREA